MTRIIAVGGRGSLADEIPDGGVRAGGEGNGQQRAGDAGDDDAGRDGQRNAPAEQPVLR
jgi:hypothetical protein